MDDPVLLDTARRVCFSVETEFYAWKAQHVAHTLSQVFRSFEYATTPAIQTLQIPPDAFEQIPALVNRDGDYICSWDCDDDGHVIAGSVGRTPITVVDPDNFLAHPRYQFCTPASRNVVARVVDMDCAPFVPYPEDPSFPRNEYLESFESFQWEDDHRDPDEQIIQYETVRRLHVNHGLEAAIINEIISLFLPFCELRLPNEGGLLCDVGQRDLPHVIWGDGQPFSSKPRLPPHFAQDLPSPDDIFNQLNLGISKFCPSLNCVTPCCQIHVGYDSGHHTPTLTPKAPLLLSSDFFEQQRACGEDCFQRVDSDGIMEADILLHDFRFLDSMLKIDPDVFPCDLADICKLPCYQIFLYRRQVIPDLEVSYPDDYREPKHASGSLDFSGKELPISPTCTHPGPCSGREDCECVKMKVVCERNCRCDATCSRRWKGCNSTCSKTKTLKCSDQDVCLCRLYSRECDPELCTRCDARDRNVHFPPQKRGPRARRSKGSKCQNMLIQRGEFKQFHIKRSKYGLGAFASESIKEGEPIGEYTGQLIKSVGHIGTIQDHGANYAYGLEESLYLIDGQWVGNPTRFLNDCLYVPPGSKSKSKAPNCTTRETVVNGERRLAVYAEQNIKKGNELFLSYGDTYWKPAD